MHFQDDLACPEICLKSGDGAALWGLLRSCRRRGEARRPGFAELAAGIRAARDMGRGGGGEEEEEEERDEETKAEF